MILSAHAESIILSAGGAESMILSMRDESIIPSAPPAESVMLSALQKHCHGSILQSNFWYFRLKFFLLSKLPPDPTPPVVFNIASLRGLI